MVSQLLSLNQGRNSVSQYALDFHVLAAECGSDQVALQDVFLKGLSEKIKDELAGRDETTSLEELINLATRLDNRLRERQRKKADGWRSRLSSPACSPHQQLSASLRASRGSYTTTSQCWGAHAAGTSQTDSGRETTTFPLRLILLLWPGRTSPGQVSSSAKRGGSSASRGALVSHTSLTSTPQEAKGSWFKVCCAGHMTPCSFKFW